jgi:hypothetical protein
MHVGFIFSPIISMLQEGESAENTTGDQETEDGVSEELAALADKVDSDEEEQEEEQKEEETTKE